jgi:hypothetical protein
MKVWLVGIALCTIIVGTCISIWGLLANWPMLVSVLVIILSSIGLIIGLLQIDAAREALTLLFSAPPKLSLNSQSSSSASPSTRGQRKRLLIFVIGAASMVGGIGLIVSKLLSDRSVAPIPSRRTTSIASSARDGSQTATPQANSSSVTESPNGILYTFADASQIDGWRPSDYKINGDSVEWNASEGHTSKGSLKVNAYLWGAQNPNRPSGDEYTHTEVLVYFRSSQLYNFTGKKASIWVYVPGTSATDGVYMSLRLKSLYGNNYTNQGEGKVYINDILDKWFQLSATIGVHNNGDPGEIDHNFDPTHMAAFGVLIKSEENKSTFTGKNIQFYLDECMIS